MFVNGAGVLDYSIRLARSDDNGATFSLTNQLVAPINGMYLRAAPAGYNRGNLNDFPRIAIAEAGPFKGRVYVVYQSAKTPTSTDTDVFFFLG